MELFPRRNGLWILAPSNPMSRKNMVIVPGYYEARKKEKKEKSSARS